MDRRSFLWSKSGVCANLDYMCIYQLSYFLD